VPNTATAPVSGKARAGGAEKIRKLGVPVRTLVSFEGH